MGLIESGKDKAKFDQMSRTEQEIVGILNLTEKDKAKTLPIYFTEEEAMADPSGNTVAGEIDYNKLNNMASQRVAASSIYAGKADIQRDIVGTVTEEDPFDTMILKKQFDNQYPDGLNADGQTFEQFINSMRLAQIKELVEIARQAENSR